MKNKFNNNIIILIGFFIYFSFHSSVQAKELIKIAIIPNFLKETVMFIENNQNKVSTDAVYERNLNNIKDNIIKSDKFVLSSENYNFTEEQMQFFNQFVFFPNDPRILKADIIISGNYDGIKNVQVWGIGVSSGRICSYTIQVEKINESNFSDIFLSVINKILGKHKELLIVYADAILDHKDSSVRYVLEDREKNKIFVDVDYDGEQQYIQNYSLKFTRLKQDGKYDLKLSTENKGVLKLNLNLEAGVIKSVRWLRDKKNATGGDFSFMSKSLGGYFLEFKFKENADGLLELITVNPLRNPFYPKTIK